MKNWIIALALLPLLLASTATAQSVDSTSTFGLEEFLGWVRKQHPIMRQAALLNRRAEVAIQGARGAFDPKAYGDYEDKSFDEKNYFRVGEAGLQLPTWLGADFKVAYNWSSGIFLNPEFNLPVNGQAVLGIEIPLAQGLLFDERRAQVQMAQWMQEANAAQQRVIQNDLLLAASETYWQWAYHYELLLTYRSALSLAQNRLQLVRESYLQGDVPEIDTVETMIQVQNRQIEVQQALVDLQNAGLELANFLWYDDIIPLELQEGTVPQALFEEQWITPEWDEIAIRGIIQEHPELRQIGIKGEQLEIKERWKKEALKPDIRVSYNWLGEGFNLAPASEEQSRLNNLFTENYKWGVQLNYPLFLRKARSGLEEVRLEQIENDLKWRQKQLELQNKNEAIFQQLQTAVVQLGTQEQMVRNYETLLAAENEKFRVGESSVFLLNSREQKLIESQLKWLKGQSEYQKLRQKLIWAQGRLQ
ncbi:MAG: TolC family protein [Bacteroidota bacterium]